MSNRDLPMMPWFPNDFAGATSAYTFVERALYRSLLDAQWTLGRLPNDPARLARIAGMTSPEELALFEDAWETVKDKFKLVSGCLYNERLEEHREKSQRLLEQRSNAGQASAAARRQRSFNDRSTSVPTPLQHPSPSPSPSLIREEGAQPNEGSTATTPQTSPSAPSPPEDKPKGKAKAAQGHHLPPDFELTPARRGIALAEGLTEPERVFSAFRNHWLAEAGQKARKRDWDMAWRTWCARESTMIKSLRRSDSGRRRTMFEEMFEEDSDDDTQAQPAA